MGKRILVLAGSPRRHGNTDCLADEFIQGAQEAGHETEKIYLKDKKINGCLGCGACQQNGGSCVQKDDMQEIYEKWLAADAVVLASPVYFYTWSAQMKTVLDRTLAIEKDVKDTKFYLLSIHPYPHLNKKDCRLTISAGLLFFTFPTPHEKIPLCLF